MSKIKFLKIREVKDPIRGTEYAAGIDFHTPVLTGINLLTEISDANEGIYPHSAEMIDRYLKDGTTSIILKPLDRIKIPTGIKCKMDRVDTMFVAKDKSGVSTKTGLTKLAGVVDYDYRGEIWMCVCNVSNVDIEIKFDAKLMQFVEVPIIISDIEMITEDEYQTYSDTIRGENGFGHTGV